jgi:hypothetical protein
MQDVRRPERVREASVRDAQWIAELRPVVLRSDLRRPRRFDPVRARQRFLAAFVPTAPQLVLTDSSEDAGSIAVQADDDSL